MHIPDGLVNVVAVNDNFAEAFGDEQLPHLVEWSFQVHGDHFVARD